MPLRAGNGRRDSVRQPLFVSRVLAFAQPLDDDGVSLLDGAIHQGDIPVPWQIAPIEGQDMPVWIVGRRIMADHQCCTSRVDDGDPAKTTVQGMACRSW